MRYVLKLWEELHTGQRWELPFNLMVLLLLGWVAALWVNLGVTDIISPPSTIEVRSSAVAGSMPMVDVSAIARGSIFNPHSGATAAPDVTGNISTAAPTTLPFRLIGTIVSDVAKLGMAVIEFQGKQELYRINAELPQSARLVRVEQYTVYLDVAGRMESLSVDLKGEPTPYSKRKFGSPPPPYSGRDVRRTGEGQVIVSADYMRGQLANMGSLLTQARALPRKDASGKIDGFKITDIVPGSSYQKLGLMNNDVVLKVNGSPLNSAERGLELYTALKNENRFEIEVERNGVRQTLMVEIQ